MNPNSPMIPLGTILAKTHEATDRWVQAENRRLDLEASMFGAGWVRCPNNNRRWYAGNAGKREPVFPLELRVTDAIWIVTHRYGDFRSNEIPLLRFETVTELESYLQENHRIAEAGSPYSNSWD